MNLIFFMLGAGFATGIHFAGWMALKKYRQDVKNAHKTGEAKGYQRGARDTDLEWETWAKRQKVPPLVPTYAFDADGTLTRSGKTVTRGGVQQVMEGEKL